MLLMKSIFHLVELKSIKHHDNQLHVTNIAKSYWENVIARIKKEERDEKEVLEAIEIVHDHLDKTLQKE